MLLRVTVGVLVFMEGSFYLTGKIQPSMAGWSGALIGLASGGALLLGLLTPIAGFAVAAYLVGVGFSLLSPPNPNLLDSALSLVLTGIITVAVIFLGPGRYSLDARFFGRREIIIPPRRTEQ